MASPVDRGMVSCPKTTKRTGFLALLVALGAAYSFAPSAFIAQDVRIPAIVSSASLALGMAVPSAIAADMVPSASDAAFQAPWIVIAAAAAGLAAALLKPKPAAAFFNFGPDPEELKRIEEEKARIAEEAEELKRREAIPQTLALVGVPIVLAAFSFFKGDLGSLSVTESATDLPPAEAPKPASKPAAAPAPAAKPAAAPAAAPAAKAPAPTPVAKRLQRRSQHQWLK